MILMKACSVLINEFIDHAFIKKQNMLNEIDFDINMVLYEKELYKEWKAF